MKFKSRKTIICGINGSGKTEFGKYLCTVAFKNVLWVTPNEDDLKKMPNNVVGVISVNSSDRSKELNQILNSVKKLGQAKKIDAVIIDELDIFVNNNTDVKTNPNINDLVILQRHAQWGGIAVIGMTRRPANIPTMMFETSDNIVIYASPLTDNTKRKFNSMHKNIPEMVASLKKGEYKFVSFTIGEEPKLCNPIPLNTKKGDRKQELKGGIIENENGKSNDR